MVQFLASFLSEPLGYYSVAAAALLLFLALALVPPSPRGRFFEWAFLAASVVALFANRWPAFRWPRSIAPDEGQWVACALKAVVDFAPWRGFDATTVGPLTCDVLTVPVIFGAPITFFSTRVIGACLMAGSMCALYYTVKWTYGERIGRLAIVPPVALLSLTKHEDFIHYSSEHLSIFLTSVALAGSAFIASNAGSRRKRMVACVIAGLCLGSAGFAKLQALPIAAVALVCLLAGIFLSARAEKRATRVELAVLLLSLCAVPIAIFTSLWLTAEVNDAVIAYLKMAAIYPASGKPVGLPFFFSEVKEYAAFLLCSLAVVLFGAATLGRKINYSPLPGWASATSILLLLASFFAIYKPYRSYPHYLLFSIVPVSFWVANVLGLLRSAGRWEKWGTPASIVYIVLFVSMIAWGALPGQFAKIKMALAVKPGQMSAQAAAIARYANRGDWVAVWGWAPDFYVQTGTIMAPREPQTERQIQQSPYRDYFRERYLSDLRRHPPRVFVDAVAPGAFGYDNPEAHGLKSFPELDSLIQDGYVLKENVSGVRIFVAKPKP
jgi:hypothetical protein